MPVNCLVCKRSIVKYIDLRDASLQLDPGLDLVFKLQVILDCDEKISRRWKYICASCCDTANKIFNYCCENEEVSEEVAAITDDFVKKYESRELVSKSNKETRITGSVGESGGTRLTTSTVSIYIYIPILVTNMLCILYLYMHQYDKIPTITLLTVGLVDVYTVINLPVN